MAVRRDWGNCALAPDWKDPERGLVDRSGNIADPTIARDYDAMFRRVYEVEYMRIFEQRLTERLRQGYADEAASAAASATAAQEAKIQTHSYLDSFDWERHKQAVECGETAGRIRLIDSDSPNPRESRRFHEDPDLACLSRTEVERPDYSSRLGGDTQTRFAEIGPGERGIDAEQARDQLNLPRYSRADAGYYSSSMNGAERLIVYRADDSYEGRQLALVDNIAAGRWTIVDAAPNGAAFAGQQSGRGGRRQAVVICGAGCYSAERTRDGQIKVYDRASGCEIAVPCADEPPEAYRLRAASATTARSDPTDRDIARSGPSTGHPSVIPADPSLKPPKSQPDAPDDPSLRPPKGQRAIRCDPFLNPSKIQHDEPER